MSLELKRKDIRNSYYCIGVAYCDLQHLLQFFNKTGFYCGVYGWRGDVYTFDNFAICTGYETIQNVKINDTEKRKLIKHYDEKARNYYNKYTLEKYGSKYYDKIKKQAQKDINALLTKLRNLIKWD